MSDDNLMIILNEEAKKNLALRLKRDELTKEFYEVCMKLHKTNIALESERIKLAEIKIKMYLKANEVYDLYTAKHKNQILIELEHYKIAELKLGIINKLIDCDKANINKFDMKTEMRIDQLSTEINYSTTPSWEEKRVRLSNIRQDLLNKIEEGEKEASKFNPIGESIVSKINELTEKKNTLESKCEKLTNDINSINCNIPDENVRYSAIVVNRNVNLTDLPDDLC